MHSYFVIYIDKSTEESMQTFIKAASEKEVRQRLKQVAYRIVHIQDDGEIKEES